MSKSTMLQNNPVSAEQIREQIRQSVKEAQADARQAQAEAKQAQGEARQAAEEAAREGVGAPLPPIPPLPPGVGITVQRPFENDIPPQAESISIAFFITVAAIIIGFPIMRAIARRIERGTPAPAVPQEVRDQLQQITQSIDAIAIEVERISEGQRFTTKLLTDQPQQQQRVTGGQ